MDRLKIATFNINGIRARLPNLLEWLEREQPDVVCLQELKAQDADFPIDDIRGAGYGAIWHGQKSWNGVAILARDSEPLEIRRGLPGDPDLLASGHPVVLAGDYNVVPTDEDIYNPRSWRKDALLQPESRACYERLLAQGWTDALRAQFPDEPVYTFWDYFRQHWQKNSGLRIDHLLLSPDLAPCLQAAGVDRWVRGQEHASDHAPTWVSLAREAD